MSNRDRTIVKLGLIIACVLELTAVFTLVSNFGWTHIATISSYILTALVAYVVYILWKEN